ncbi:hypothetical protein ER57_15040 [Smithella sp. SCADC]|jgi:phosphatidylserine synthase|nr:hypothetical protein ER57_15040 [Smithella sp. SCADC]HAR48549.1 hypothetical protein [Smithella sp.]
MKKLYVFALLILSAILLFTAAFLHNAHGPYWLSYNSDPEYLYLISSLTLAESKQTGSPGHPGSTLQILGAATLKISHALDFSEKDSLEFAVLKNPEFYLTIINTVLVTLNTLLLFIIGLTAFILSKNIWLSLLLQLSPFLSNNIITHTGFYGNGVPEILYLPNYFNNIINLCLLNPLLFLVWFFSAGFILRFGCFSAGVDKAARKVVWQDTSFRTLSAVATAQMFAVLIVAKHPAGWYLAPVFSLSGFMLFLTFLYLQKINYFNNFNLKKGVFFIVIILLFTCAWRIVEIRNLFMQKSQIKQESLAVYQKMETLIFIMHWTKHFMSGRRSFRLKRLFYGEMATG